MNAVIFILFKRMDNQHKSNKEQQGFLNTCPMHPEIVQDKPGNCPICGMNLVPVKNEADKSASP